MNRRRAVGAEVVEGGVSFRVWAPAQEEVAVVIDGRDFLLRPETNGYFSAVIEEARAGTLYKFRVGDGTFPDPASRFQPEGVHGPSRVIDPTIYRWRDRDWRGIGAKGRVVYELHIGTFTREGTYAAAIEHLPELAKIGINTIELMPVNAFAGTFGWGYDGVDLWAPMHVYGTPDDLRRLIDAAHALNIGVILDVVYNHFGPDGCYVKQFTPEYFTDEYENEWGEAVNFASEGVRTFVAENAAYWIDEFHFDGLRIDATQSMFDATRPHVTQLIAESARAAARDREIWIVAENEPQETAFLRERGYDALWNDDWHHAARVALTGRIEAYYSDYCGRPQEFVSMAKLGFLYQGQWYRWQKKHRGTPSHDLAPEHFVCYLQNHDQVANSARGLRLDQLTSPGRLRAMTALLLLQPQTPMLFQGQELGAPAPFLYFADHEPELAEKVRKGRAKFLEQFPSMHGIELAAPHDRATFEACKLDHSERNEHVVALHRDLLRLRSQSPFNAQRNDWLHGSVLGEEAFALRWLTDSEDDRLLLVNLGRDVHFDPVADPLLAPPAGASRWTLLWSSEAPEYGGSGTSEVEREGAWTIPGQTAIVLRATD